MKTIIDFLILLALIVFGVWAYQNWIYKPQVVTVPTSPNLKPGESAAVTFNPNNNTITIQQRDKNSKVSISQVFVPAESPIDIRVSSTTRKVEVKYNKTGFCTKPTISFGYTDKIIGGLGMRFIYYNEWGAGASVNSDMSLSVFGDYRLYKLSLRNVSLFVNYTPVNNHGYDLRFGINVYLN